MIAHNAALHRRPTGSNPTRSTKTYQAMAELSLPPQHIDVQWNSADAISRGVRELPGDQVSPSKLMGIFVLQVQVNRIFRLIGTLRTEPSIEVVLKIEDGSSKDSLRLSCEEPPFTGAYAISHQPPPTVSETHSDCLFTLEVVEAPNNNDRT